MSSNDRRDFSFQAHDDEPSSFPTAPHLQYPYPQPPPQQHLHPSSTWGEHNPQGYRNVSDASWHSYEPPLETAPDRTPSASDSHSAPIGHQNTVIRKQLPPEAAAAAAATLAAVQEDLAPPPLPPPHQGGHHELPPPPSQDQGVYSRSQSETPTYPPSISTPSSQAPLIQIPPPPPQHQWTGTPGNSPGSGGRPRVLVDPLLGQYTDNPYKRMSTTWDPSLSQTAFDGAHDVLSDDDDDYGRGTTGASQGGAKGGISGMLGKKPSKPVLGEAGNLRGGAVESGGLLPPVASGEKSEWLRSRERSSKKTRWVMIVLGIVVLLAIAGGVAAGIILSKKHNSSGGNGSSSQSAEEDFKANGDLNKNSHEIQKLMNNPDLHKVFHGMDYTPLNAIYPECITNPPTQNNITRDIAVLSLLTDKVRLYGTDCNQTEMVLHAIDALGVDMKLWIGVWLDKNTTTNDRQLAHLYNLIENKSYHDKFDGVAVGNEVLFAQTLTETQLFQIISDVKTNLTNLGYNIPVGTSDLGSNWNTNMASKVDVLMANVHPFFAGVVVEKAANWTWDFFQKNDVVLTDGLSPKPRVMISEVGWPSGGGTDGGSVAGISEMNRFMADFICRENGRSTEYFWFSGFDEPWKIRFNEPAKGKEWEDKWGLLDVNRNLKKGLIIPTCN
ncbi:glycoside hydrolase superfamily [Trichophaea hybrida]|nr:glycoside hydrolase superfamily [Trichophaea hybrida]